VEHPRRRIGLLFGLFVALLALGALRSVYLGAFAAAKLRRVAADQQVTRVVVPALRGSILDRNGVPLAVSQPAADVYATPYLVKDPVAAAKQLAPLLGQSPDALTTKLAARSTGFVYLARRVPDAGAKAISRLRIAGIAEKPSQLRDYPNRTLAAQVLGAVGIDGQGLSGLEYSRDRVLRGLDGQRQIVSDAIGQPISIRDLRAPRPGATLGLTLDAAIQSRVEDVLAGIGATYRPKGATAIVMDPRTNEILAMANWPRVDANAIGSAPPYALQNRAVAYNYEPGSTFKAVTVAGALSDALVTPDTTFYLPPQIQVADRVIHDAELRGSQTMSVARILAQSSNVGAITIGLRLGRVRFDQWVRQFGFGSPTGVDLPGEERGQVLPVQRYSGSSMGNLPIGQGESVTPLQIATAYAAIADGGILRPPHIVASIGRRSVPMPPAHRVVTPAVAGALRQMLVGVLAPGGTASEVKIPGYNLAGKTGTASKIDPATGQYSSSRYVASFVGFAPAHDPRLLVAVMVDEPQGAIYGGTVAAPAFGQIMSFALPYLRIPPG
jgi:cell division protein FtsI/penicillin-binding protein 2